MLQELRETNASARELRRELIEQLPKRARGQTLTDMKCERTEPCSGGAAHCSNDC